MTNAERGERAKAWWPRDVGERALPPTVARRTALAEVVARVVDLKIAVERDDRPRIDVEMAAIREALMGLDPRPSTERAIIAGGHAWMLIGRKSKLVCVPVAEADHWGREPRWDGGPA